jgi:outer membrane protein OmpU
MKKILLATTLLAGFAGAASADVTLSGYGRFGMVYFSNPGLSPLSALGGAGQQTRKTVLDTRLRINLDAKMTTDGGVNFGGRIRMQSDNGSTAGGARLSSAKLFAESNGMRLEVGNVETAYDSAALFYNSEMGFEDSSVGESDYGFASFSSGPYSALTPNRMGVFLGYSAGPLNARISYINPDQTLSHLPAGVASEMGVSADYTFGAFTVSGAYVANANGAKKDKENFVGVAYAMSSNVNIGLNHYYGTNMGNTTTLYGSYGMGAITLRGYVTNNDLKANKNSTVGGIGADYDLGGGARLSGSVRPDFNGDTSADLGVRFNF